MKPPVDPGEREWEALVIGTGMGGATLGYALAKAGKDVLFCEAGRSHLDSTALAGDFAESFAARRSLASREVLSRAGRCASPISDATSGRKRGFIPFLGCGTGGSSALYGMALERFVPADFEPRARHPQGGASALPEKWPIAYEELEPYYGAAEALYRVRASAGASLEPPPLSAAGRELFDFFARSGLHPRRLATACDYAAGCRCCQSYLCARACKNDASRICLIPALRDYGARLLNQCRVVQLEASGRRVGRVGCLYQGKKLTLRAKTVILAAGALETPRILLSSACSAWPRGLANASGLVGENLMRHYIDLYAVKTDADHRSDRTLKELALDDFYCAAGGKYGTIQTFGPLPPPAALFAALREDRRGRRASALFRNYLGQFKRSYVLSSILEDLPYPGNKVELSRKGELAIKYRIHEPEKARIRRFREIVKEALDGYPFALLPQAEKNSNLAHACGTCRFGEDSARSVLDKWNRAHGLANLYVVDASFFPSSGGTGPALTIAANALRVADRIAAD